MTVRRIIGAAIAAAGGDLRPGSGQYRCGGILVILKADTADSIGDVIDRMGGEPATDILQEFTAVRDLLDPAGVVEDMSEATVYSVAVPVGQEEATAAAYAADPAVYAAALDRETIGSTASPDTAKAVPTISWLASVGALLVVASGVLSLTIRRAENSGSGTPLRGWAETIGKERCATTLSQPTTGPGRPAYRWTAR